MAVEWLMMCGIQVPDEAGLSTYFDSIGHHRCTNEASPQLTRIPWIDSEMSRSGSPFLSTGVYEPLLTSRFTAVFGPGATLWYKFLQRRIVLKSENATIAARVLVDQTVFASTNLFLFLSSMAYMEGTDPKEKLNSTYWNALQKNWMVWPAVQAINFKLVPLEHRVLVVNIVSLGECFSRID
ncbi:MAG: hypothetical protein Q9195_008432 [Heterodermia aff. obscurata]